MTDSGDAAVQASTGEPSPAGSDPAFTQEQAEQQMAELRSDPDFAARLVKGDPAALSQYRELQRQLHQMPEEGTTDLAREGAAEQAMSDAYAAPETPDGYAFKLPGILYQDADPADFKADLTEAREVAHRMGMPDRFAQEVLDLVGELAANPKDPATREAEAEATLDYLRRNWGADFNSRLATLQTLIDKGGDDFKQLLDLTGIGYTRRFWDRLTNIATAQGLL